MTDYPSYAVVPERAFDDLHELARVLLCACGNSNDHDIERVRVMLEQVKERWSREAVAWQAVHSR